ncbi:PDK repeat-containing protein [Thioflavicoccus mobilis 8321]|uniref:PDK repeat-containing protein n=1 Tax=Thioflavicoccus mobilis 8321 TaxID=765912 RepID=L0GYC6_9GAMM|nr:PDK repeat-containing protein [Thioflavicoccus mobilis 8321]
MRTQYPRVSESAFPRVSLLCGFLTRSSLLALVLVAGLSASTELRAAAAEAGLGWDPVDDERVTHYEVYWGEASGTYEHTLTATSNVANLPGLVEGQTYYAAVKACSEALDLCSDFSEELVFTADYAEPIAGFNVDKTAGEAPLTVTFANTSEGVIEQCEWALEDGATLSGCTLAYTFDTAGSYSVSLTVTGPGGTATMDRADLIEVTAPPPDSDPGTDPVADLPLEAGDVLVDRDWQWIDFQQTYAEPIVIAKSLSSLDEAPAVVRIDGVESGGFWVRVQNWDELDDSHATEAVGYLVVERGIHQLPDGQWLEADLLDLDGTSERQVDFIAPFAEEPVVISNLMSANDPAAVTTRQRYISKSGLSVQLQGAEANDVPHGAETVAYLAWESSVGEINGVPFVVGATGDEVTDEPQHVSYGTSAGAPPVLLMDMQSRDGRDTANLRWQDKVSVAFDVWVDEEQSRDSEVRHTNETVGYIALFTETTPFDSAPADIIEVGEIEADSTPQRVDFARTFTDPVVIAKAMSANETDPYLVRITDVDATGFSLRLQEWQYLDGVHGTEHVAYMVVERGRHQLPNGAWIEADELTTEATNAFVPATYRSPFLSSPIVLTSLASDNDTWPATVRVRNVGLGGFEIGLRMEEAAKQVHGAETVSYVAWPRSQVEWDGLHIEAGATGDTVTHSRYTVSYAAEAAVPPLIYIGMQSTDGGDTAETRCDRWDGTSLDLWIEEEQSRNTEIIHTTETVGYLVISDLVDLLP